jgi:chromosome condensin MukBEF ATPase and DNA-binding subunit MukB
MMNDQIRNDPKKFSNYQMQELVRQQISSLLLAYPELEEDDQLRTDMIEGETDAFELLHQLELKRQDAETLIEGLDDRIRELKTRQERFNRREEAIRSLMYSVMQIARIQKAELAEATLSIRNGTQKVIVTDESLLTDNYWRIKREVNKTALKVDLDDGITIPGAVLSNPEPTLSIRTK